jgi:hypothetical protein
MVTKNPTKKVTKSTSTKAVKKTAAKAASKKPAKKLVAKAAKGVAKQATSKLTPRQTMKAYLIDNANLTNKELVEMMGESMSPAYIAATRADMLDTLVVMKAKHLI